MKKIKEPETEVKVLNQFTANRILINNRGQKEIWKIKSKKAEKGYHLKYKGKIYRFEKTMNKKKESA